MRKQEEIVDKFAEMGARVRIERVPSHLMGQRSEVPHRAGADPQRFRIDVVREPRGEIFHIVHRTDVRLQVLDVRDKDRHLLLLAQGNRHGPVEELKSRFLCGHDERAWFVAAIPEDARAFDVQEARDALKPEAVWDAMREYGVPMEDRDLRRTKAFVRQGEWFFIPRPAFAPGLREVLHDEAIRRGAGKPHVCQHLCRTGGEMVYVSTRYPNGLTQAEYNALPKAVRVERWWRMAREAQPYVKGYIRHPDHATIWLDCWHEVVMNTERNAKAMRDVAFLD